MEFLIFLFHLTNEKKKLNIPRAYSGLQFLMSSRIFVIKTKNRKISSQFWNLMIKKRFDLVFQNHLILFIRFLNVKFIHEFGCLSVSNWIEIHFTCLLRAHQRDEQASVRMPSMQRNWKVTLQLDNESVAWIEKASFRQWETFEASKESVKIVK